MRYYFHIRDGRTLDEDLDGVDIPNASEDHREALRTARTMAEELLRFEEPIEDLSFEIADSSGNLVVVVPLSDLSNLH